MQKLADFVYMDVTVFVLTIKRAIFFLNYFICSYWHNVFSTESITMSKTSSQMFRVPYPILSEKWTPMPQSDLN